MRSRLFAVFLSAMALWAYFLNANMAWAQSDLSTDNKMLYKTGSPFLWVGDTAWFLMHASYSNADSYLANREAKGFSVVQAGCLGWGDTTMNVPNDDGVTPFVNGATNVGAQRVQAYWDNLNRIINNAKSKQIYIGLLPTNANSGESNTNVLRDNTTAYSYGHFLGSTFKQSNVIWILGGDSDIYYAPLQPLTRQLARGIADGNAGLSADPNRSDNARNFGTTLMTFHPSGSVPQSSSMVYANDIWLDFNMIQTYRNHGTVFQMVKDDYARNKPVVLGEGQYEGAVGSSALSVRQEAYWSYLAGAPYTYGNIMDGGENAPCCSTEVNNNLDSPGAASMVNYRNFLATRDWSAYTPDQSFILSGASSGASVNAAKIRGNTSAVVYLSTTSANVSLNISRLNATGVVQARRYNPANHTETVLGEYPSSGSVSFTTGGLDDAVILLDAIQGSTNTIRINAGAHTYVDPSGYVWRADQYATGGSVYSSTAPISATTSDPLYRSERWGTFTYDIPVVNGAYEVVLHFAEVYWSAAGQRVFDVRVEGSLAVNDLDIFSRVGQNAALRQSVSTVVSDGRLTLEFISVVDAAKISAIELIPTAAPAAPTMLQLKR